MSPIYTPPRSNAVNVIAFNNSGPVFSLLGQSGSSTSIPVSGLVLNKYYMAVANIAFPSATYGPTDLALGVATFGPVSNSTNVSSMSLAGGWANVQSGNPTVLFSFNQNQPNLGSSQMIATSADLVLFTGGAWLMQYIDSGSTGTFASGGATFEVDLYQMN